MGKLDFQNLQKIFEKVSSINKDDYAYLYNVYSLAYDGIIELYSNKNSNLPFSYETIDHLKLISYILGEYSYSVQKRTIDEIIDFKENENILESFTSVVADKYISSTHFSFSEEKLTHRYLPPISSLYSYVNFILNALSTFKVKDNSLSVIDDMFFKAMNIAKCTLDLLIDGFETEAFSSWRTLHECECTLIILTKYKNIALSSYVKHMTYGLAFKDMMDDKDKQTSLFNTMKDEMKQYELRSKDIKKYIEYGWLLSICDFDYPTKNKLNFRDGPQKLAGLEEYAKRYETSSEIIHNTPLLIYSNKKYFYYVSLLSLYESFFRLEAIFVDLYFSKTSEEGKHQYMNMRNIYYTQLEYIYRREKSDFERWKQK